MDVIVAAQAIIAQKAGACAVMALERIPADIRQDGGVARMSDPAMIKEIQKAVTIPVMAKARIGHQVPPRHWETRCRRRARVGGACSRRSVGFETLCEVLGPDICRVS